MADVEQIRREYDNANLTPGHQQRYVAEARYWIGPLLGHIDRLEQELAVLREQKTPRDYPDDDADAPDSCQCGVPGACPPCSWCTSDDNPLNAQEG